jgi:hypothetical protein
MSQKSTRSDARARPSRQVLAELPLRVVLFLGAICRYDVIRTTLQTGGYGPEAHREGCRLLQAVCDYPSVALDHGADERARAALGAVDEYVRMHFTRYRAVAERYFPRLTGLFPSLTHYEPNASLRAMRTLLDWLAESESAEQNPIAQKLAERGLTIAERRRLSDLVALATSIETPAITDDTAADRDQALLDLYNWYADWSATARALIKRKDHRCSLGIGEKRAKQAAAALAA